MKTNKKYTLFQKFMIVFIPVIVLLLVAAVSMCAAFMILPMSNFDFMNTGYVTIALAIASSLLAVIALAFAIFGKGSDEEE